MDLPAVRIIRDHYISKGFVRGGISPDEIVIYVPEGVPDDILVEALVEVVERMVSK